MPPLSANAPHSLSLAAWGDVAGKAARITLDAHGRPGTQGAFMGWMSHLDAQYSAENRAAIQNLFNSIHGLAESAAAAVHGLLEPHFDKSAPLTGRLVHRALALVKETREMQIAGHQAANNAARLCDAWDERADELNLSPRKEPDGHQAYQAFTLLLNERCAAANAHGLAGRGEVLDTLMDEIRHAPAVKEAVKDRFLAYMGMEREQIRFAENAPRSPLRAIRDLHDPADCWRLVMDGQCHAQPLGRAHFENECGYMHGMLRALNRMLAEVDEPLDAEAYLRLHDLAVDGVHERDHVGPGGLMKPGFRDGAVGFGLVAGNNMTVAGRAEFEASPQKLGGWCGIVARNGGGSALETVRHTPEECRAKAAQILRTYHEAAREAPQEAGPAREDAILRAIAICCRDLDQHHLFSDGNIRSVAFLAMNKLLLQHGMSPTLFQNPNVIDMHSVDELVALMREGQQQFKHL